MHPDKALARLHPIQKCLLVRQRQIPGRVGKDHGVVLLQCRTAHLLGQNLLDGGIDFLFIRFAIRAFKLSFIRLYPRIFDFECGACFAQFRQHFFCCGNGTVAKSGGNRNYKHLFGGSKCRPRQAERSGNYYPSQQMAHR